jgi:hypothetical protein
MLVMSEVHEKEKSEVSEERKEPSSEKCSKTHFVSEEEASEATNLFRFSPFDINLFIEEESKKAKEMKILSNLEEYTGTNEEVTFSKDKLFIISKMRKSILDLTKGHMVNLRIVDYLDIVQKYSKAAQKIISETIKIAHVKRQWFQKTRFEEYEKVESLLDSKDDTPYFEFYSKNYNSEKPITYEFILISPSISSISSTKE